MMNLTPIESILVKPNRQRREHKIDAHQDLVTSISETEVGLQNPLVLRQEGESLVLVSGERRLRAIQDIYTLGGIIRHAGQEVPPGQVPYTLIGQLSELAAEEAELEENIRRVDLTWAERAEATTRLRALRTKQAASKSTPFPTMKDIAVEVRGSGEGINQENTRREVIISKYLSDPDVRKASTLDEAFKVVKKKEQAQKHAELAASMGVATVIAAHQCYNLDCLDWMVNQPSEQFDVIISDPPYGMGADEFGDSGGAAAGAHSYQDDEAYWFTLMGHVIPHLYRLAKPQSHAYLFCDIDKFHDLREMMTVAGWKVFRTPLIWHKPGGSRTPWVNGGPQRRYELILFAAKGGRPVNLLRGDILEHPSDTNLGHSAQKPTSLFQDLLERSTFPGDRVFDPFCGTGPIFPAATAAKCLATGVEKDPTSYGISLSRLRSL